MNIRWTTIVFLLISVHPALAQKEDTDLKIFGYFQNQFQYNRCKQMDQEQTTFNLQQMNLFLQKELNAQWNSFISIEFINSYSSFYKWGAFNLEEAWVRYRRSKEFNLKFGLQVPIFNNLNEIKNRTPLLPYVIRPLAYETSFKDFISVDELVPSQAFIQAYGYFPIGNIKFDHAVYVGNSPNINSDTPYTQTGVDTSTSFLVGGRFGLRFQNLKIGASVTYDKANQIEQEIFGQLENSVEYQSASLDSASLERLYNLAGGLHEMKRVRGGFDITYDYRDLSIESELISVYYQEDLPHANFNKHFFYITLGYRVTERLFTYLSAWSTDENRIWTDFTPSGKIDYFSGDVDVQVPNIGFSYHISDRITFKGQFAHVKISSDLPNVYPTTKSVYIESALSVMF
ncbi:hypothetical protein JW960_03900 [candidate division KSB1 bacterium]|nr:hypothetical protein [candidate division KSB1 bacterium]